jgi:hypothetical protein
MSVEQAIPTPQPQTGTSGAPSGMEGTQTDPARAGAQPPDLASAPLHEVRRYLRNRPEPSASDHAAAPSGAAGPGSTGPGSAESGAPSAAAPEVAGQQAPPSEPGDGQTETRHKQRAAPSPDSIDPVLLQRQNASLAGNLRQVQEERRQEHAAFQQMQAQLTQVREQQQALERRNFGYEIAALPPDAQREAWAAWEGQKQATQHQEQLSQYHGYLEQVKQNQDQREQQLLGLTQTMQIAEQRQALTPMFQAFAPFLAEKFGVEPAFVSGIMGTDAYQQAVHLYSAPQHAAIIGEMLAAVAEFEGKRAAQGRQANVQTAVQQGVHRMEAGAGTGGGMASADHIRNMPDADFQSLRQQYRRQFGRVPIAS